MTDRTAYQEDLLALARLTQGSFREIMELQRECAHLHRKREAECSIFHRGLWGRLKWLVFGVGQ